MVEDVLGDGLEGAGKVAVVVAEMAGSLVVAE